MFVGDEVRVNAGFAEAAAMLVSLARGGAMVRAAEDAYAEGICRLAHAAGPLGPALCAARLVGFDPRARMTGEGHAVIMLRWTAMTVTGGLFPALDADLTLIPTSGQFSLLRLAGAYRLPPSDLPGGMNLAIAHEVATATARAFTSRAAAAITLLAGPSPRTAATA